MHLKSTTNVGTNIAGAPTYPLEWADFMVRNLVQYCMAQKGCCQLINLQRR